MLSRNVKVFSVDSLKRYEETLYGSFKENLDDSVYARSVNSVIRSPVQYLSGPKTMDIFSQGEKQNTLAAMMPANGGQPLPIILTELNGAGIQCKPMVMDSAAQFMPAPPPPFSLDSSSLFYKSLHEVYNINRNLTDEQMTIARYWDDNPFVIEHSGHMMFGNKKITPGGHWMGICAIASKQSDADAVKTARAYALTAIALYEGFISCWDEKYRSSYIRPVTAINETFDPAWLPFLQTPPFPEYTSGHSTITASAATVLTSLFGDNFAFQDTSDLRYIGMQRHFNSFSEAAAEVSISRVYGGIHYRFSVDTGAEMGNRLGEFINRKLLTDNPEN